MLTTIKLMRVMQSTFSKPPPFFQTGGWGGGGGCASDAPVLDAHVAAWNLKDQSFSSWDFFASFDKILSLKNAIKTPHPMKRIIVVKKMYIRSPTGQEKFIMILAQIKKNLHFNYVTYLAADLVPQLQDHLSRPK